MSKTENLGLQLLHADSEKDVRDIILSDDIMRSQDNWHPVDGRDTNFNIVNNQSSSGGKAATELITNMVDAMLTRGCLEKNIDPKSPDAPKTMYQAVDDFVKIFNGGKIINAEDAWLREYSEKNLVIGVTGSNKKEMRPCYTFCDNGEGQHPDDFRRTFLSLGAKNKSEISFVQGRYNMGSSGVLSFCGQHWFKLILSRRYDKNSQWGWTLIRKNKPSSGMPFAEYFAPSEKIQTLAEDAVFPFQIKGGKKFDGFSLITGTIIKLYEYRIGKTYTGFKDAREAFNENLVETILPFRILDFRQKPDPGKSGLRPLGIDERRFCGMEFLLTREHKEEKKESVPEDDSLGHVGTVRQDLGEITVTAVLLKKEASNVDWIRKLNFRIFHHANGQVQYKQLRGFLTQCGLPALKDRVMIFVDASRLTDGAHIDIWKGDREAVRDTDAGEKYLSTVKDIIRNSDLLKDFNRRIAEEELNSVAKESSQKLIKDIVARDKNFALLLSDTVPDFVPLPDRVPDPPPQRDDLQRHPTEVKIKDKKRDMNLCRNKTRPIPCTTDATDDYFTRADNRGVLFLSSDDAENKFRCNYSLNNGELFLSLSPRESVEVGEAFRFKIGLKDDGMQQAVYTEEVEMTIIPPKIKNKKPNVPNKPRHPKAVGLPEHKLLTKDGRALEHLKQDKTEQWAKADCPEFDETDGGYVKEVGEGKKIYYINYDNRWFQNYYQSAKKSSGNRATEEKFILGMRILMLGLEHALSSASDEDRQKCEEDVFRRMVAKGAASVVLTLCEGLPKGFDLYRDDNE